MKPAIVFPLLLAFNATAGAEPAIRIRVIDKAGLDARDRAIFEARAKKILMAAGVSSTWRDCQILSATRATASCPDELGAAELVVQILPEGGARTRSGEYNWLGSAIADREGGVYALIYYPNVERSADALEIPVPALLALAAVHEIGHLILGSRAHRESGVMHPRWDRREVADMVLRNRYFSPSQSVQLQKRVAARVLSR